MKLKRELVEEKKKPATHKNPIKVQSPKRIADLEKAIKDQEKIRDEADEKMKEIEKSFNNQDIVKYLQSTDLNRDMARDDGTAWCASFLNWCIEATGKYKGLKKDAASAESWRKWGEKISEPRYGAITIVTRSSNPVKYHVGFYTGVKDVSKKIGTEEVDVVGKNGKIKKEKKVKYKTIKKVSLLSGNISNQITESSSWAINESDDPKLHLIEYRWPTVLEKK